MSDRHQQPGPPYTEPGQPHTQPGQSYTQPAPPYTHPGQPYAAGHHPFDAPAPAAPAPRSADLGRTALVASAVAVAFSLALRLVTPVLYMAVGYVTDILSILVNLIALAVAIAGLALGIAAMRRRASPLLAAIAIGLALSIMIGAVGGWLSWVATYFS